jgi:hypothetical protein
VLTASAVVAGRTRTAKEQEAMALEFLTVAVRAARSVLGYSETSLVG